uniref:AAA_11 domain-containing protein n=1 Tax=Haemonchus contortus TaxID=6289 RepID=A0A7I4XTX1_HAECO
MAHEAGWARGRMVDFWIAGADHTTQMRVDNALFDTDSKRLSVRIMGFAWNHAITALLSTHGWRQDDHHVIGGLVRLGKLARAANATNKAVSRFLHIVERIPSGTTGHRILDTVYRKSTFDCPSPSTGAYHQAAPSNFPNTVRTNHQTITLTTDQQAAFALAMAGHPISGINAAFGTGKTLLAAIIAAYYVKRGMGPIIVTTTTNNGAAQFTNTLLTLKGFPDLYILRYLSETSMSHQPLRRTYTRSLSPWVVSLTRN